MRKRILSMLLCMVLCLSFAPTAVFAEDMRPELPTNLHFEGTVAKWENVDPNVTYHVKLKKVENGAALTVYAIAVVGQGSIDLAQGFGIKGPGEYQFGIVAQRQVNGQTYESLYEVQSEKIKYPFEGTYYTVNYDANGGSGTMNPVTCIIDAEKGYADYVFPGCRFTAPEGKEFDCWEVEGITGPISPQTTHALFDDMIVKAVWKDVATPQPTTYTVSFNMNGRGNQVADQTINAGEKVTEPAEPTEIGYMFVGWCKDSEFNTAWNFDTDTVTADTTLYALWAKNIANYTVTFDMNGHGNQVETQTVKEGEKAAKPADPTASGWTFGGWYKEAACSTAFNFDTAITADTKVYAKWTENTVKPVDPEKPNKPEKPEKPEKPVKPAKPGKPASPNTADTNQALLWVMLMILGGALVGAELYSRKRKN